MSRDMCAALALLLLLSWCTASGVPGASRKLAPKLAVLAECVSGSEPFPNVKWHPQALFVSMMLTVSTSTYPNRAPAQRRLLA